MFSFLTPGRRRSSSTSEGNDSALQGSKIPREHSLSQSQGNQCTTNTPRSSWKAKRSLLVSPARRRQRRQLANQNTNGAADTSLRGSRRNNGFLCLLGKTTPSSKKASPSSSTGYHNPGPPQLGQSGKQTHENKNKERASTTIFSEEDTLHESSSPSLSLEHANIHIHNHAQEEEMEIEFTQPTTTQNNHNDACTGDDEDDDHLDQWLNSVLGSAQSGKVRKPNQAAEITITSRPPNLLSNDSYAPGGGTGSQTSNLASKKVVEEPLFALCNGNSETSPENNQKDRELLPRTQDPQQSRETLVAEPFVFDGGISGIEISGENDSREQGLQIVPPPSLSKTTAAPGSSGKTRRLDSLLASLAKRGPASPQSPPRQHGATMAATLPAPNLDLPPWELSPIGASSSVRSPNNKKMDSVQSVGDADAPNHNNCDLALLQHQAYPLTASRSEDSARSELETTSPAFRDYQRLSSRRRLQGLDEGMAARSSAASSSLNRNANHKEQDSTLPHAYPLAIAKTPDRPRSFSELEQKMSAIVRDYQEFNRRKEEEGLLHRTRSAPNRTLSSYLQWGNGSVDEEKVPSATSSVCSSSTAASSITTPSAFLEEASSGSTDSSSPTTPSLGNNNKSKQEASPGEEKPRQASRALSFEARTLTYPRKTTSPAEGIKEPQANDDDDKDPVFTFKARPVPKSTYQTPATTKSRPKTPVRSRPTKPKAVVENNNNNNSNNKSAPPTFKARPLPPSTYRRVEVVAPRKNPSASVKARPAPKSGTTQQAPKAGPSFKARPAPKSTYEYHGPGTTRSSKDSSVVKAPRPAPPTQARKEGQLHPQHHHHKKKKMMESGNLKGFHSPTRASRMDLPVIHENLPSPPGGSSSAVFARKLWELQQHALQGSSD